MRERIDTIVTVVMLSYVVYAAETGDNDLSRARQWARYCAWSVKHAWVRTIEPAWRNELRRWL